MELSRRGIALATAALQVAAMNRAARATPLLPPRPASPRRGRRSTIPTARREAENSKP
jgi:hypothetical protein